MTDNKGIIILVCVFIVVIIVVSVIGIVLYTKNKSDEEETKTETKQPPKRAEHNVADPGTSGAQSIDNTEQVKEQIREKFPQVFIAFKIRDSLVFVTSDFSLSTKFEDAQVFELEGNYLWKDGSYFGINGMTTKDEEKVSVMSPFPEIHRYDLSQLHIACLSIIDELNGEESEILLLSLIEVLQDLNVNITNNAVQEPVNGYALYTLNDSSVILKTAYLDDIPEKNESINSELDIKMFANEYSTYNSIEVRSAEPNKFGNYDYETRYIWETPDNRQLVSGSKLNKDFIPVEYHNLYIVVGDEFEENFPFDPLSIEHKRVEVDGHTFNVPVPIRISKAEDFETIPYGPFINYYVATNYFTNGTEKGIPFTYEYDGRLYKILPYVNLLYRINNDGRMLVLVKWENDEIEEVEYNKDRVSNNNIITHGISVEEMFQRYPKVDYTNVDPLEIEATMKTMKQLEPLLRKAEDLEESNEIALEMAKMKKNPPVIEEENSAKGGDIESLPTEVLEHDLQQQKNPEIREAIEQELQRRKELAEEQQPIEQQPETTEEPVMEQFQNFSNAMKRLVK